MRMHRTAKVGQRAGLSQARPSVSAEGRLSLFPTSPWPCHLLGGTDTSKVSGEELGWLKSLCALSSPPHGTVGQGGQPRDKEVLGCQP